MLKCKIVSHKWFVCCKILPIFLLTTEQKSTFIYMQCHHSISILYNKNIISNNLFSLCVPDADYMAFKFVLLRKAWIWWKQKSYKIMSLYSPVSSPHNLTKLGTGSLVLWPWAPGTKIFLGRSIPLQYLKWSLCPTNNKLNNSLSEIRNKSETFVWSRWHVCMDCDKFKWGEQHFLLIIKYQYCSLRKTNKRDLITLILFFVMLSCLPSLGRNRCDVMILIGNKRHYAGSYVIRTMLP